MRRNFVLVVSFLCVAATSAAALAETAGIISGRVSDDKTRVAVAGVQVIAKSPSATYHTTTDAHGAYRFLSVLPDTYSLSFLKSGYASYSISVVVLNGSQQAINVPLSRTLKVIATTHARSAGKMCIRDSRYDCLARRKTRGSAARLDRQLHRCGRRARDA